MAGIGGFISALKIIWQYGDALAPLLEGLAATLPQAGQSMIASGESAIDVSRYLSQQGGHPVNAQKTAGDAAASIEATKAAINQVASQLEDVADQIEQITVPVLDPTYTTLNLSGIGMGSYSLVSGFKPTTSKPFMPFHDGLDEAAGLLRNASGQLHQASSGLNNLSASLGNAGSNLNTLGGHLKDGGQRLVQAGN
jgi:ABC-type transporter Mla subunit MlaD